MGLCKCRQCAMVVTSKVWAATTGGACPSCGHGQFSISFARPAVAGPVATDVIPAIDPHGRKRKAIRLEDLSGSTRQSSDKPSFKERMRDYGRTRPGPDRDDNQA